MGKVLDVVRKHDGKRVQATFTKNGEERELFAREKLRVTPNSRPPVFEPHRVVTDPLAECYLVHDRSELIGIYSLAAFHTMFWTLSPDPIPSIIHSIETGRTNRQDDEVMALVTFAKSKWDSIERYKAMAANVTASDKYKKLYDRALSALEHLFDSSDLSGAAASFLREEIKELKKDSTTS